MSKSKHTYVLQGNHLKDDFNSHNRNCYQDNNKITKRKYDKVKNMNKALSHHSKGKISLSIPIRKGNEIIFPNQTK